MTRPPGSCGDAQKALASRQEYKTNRTTQRMGSQSRVVAMTAHASSGGGDGLPSLPESLLTHMHEGGRTFRTEGEDSAECGHASDGHAVQERSPCGSVFKAAMLLRVTSSLDLNTTATLVVRPLVSQPTALYL